MSRKREQAEKPIRPLTQDLITAVHLDVWPGVSTIVDFGIDSDRHLGALQFAIRNELVTPHELDAAIAKGDRLTEIARRGNNPYRDVEFWTVWDDIRRDESLASAGRPPRGAKPAATKRPTTWRWVWRSILRR